MPNFRIFTESKADVRFLRDFIWESFNAELSETLDFDTLGGYGGYKEDRILKQSIRQNHDNGNQTIIILDADNDFAQRVEEIKRDFIGFDIPINLFLFPDNKLAGNLEELLTVVAEERKLIECFLSYEECAKDYNVSLSKARIYAYLDTLLPAGDKIHRKNDLRVEENRNYRNPAHWNLHHEYLQPLHDFLSPFFTEAK